jgi:large-conductance mechanosensitive channel
MLIQALIPLYNEIEQKVKILCGALGLLESGAPSKGRPAKMTLVNAITAGVYKQETNTATKKAVFNELRPHVSYNRFVVNMNRYALHALTIFGMITAYNKKNSHLIKHIDSTDIPVSTNRKAKYHKTMKDFASWGKTGKGWFYGLKLHLVTDVRRDILSIAFTSGNVDDRDPVMKMTEDMEGVFVADAGYISKNLEKKFNKDFERIIFIKPRRNMKRIMTWWQDMLYATRMRIELNFRSLKMFYGLVTSLPRSPNGYFANYIYSLLAYVMA